MGEGWTSSSGCVAPWLQPVSPCRGLQLTLKRPGSDDFPHGDCWATGIRRAGCNAIRDPALTGGASSQAYWTVVASMGPCRPACRSPSWRPGVFFVHSKARLVHRWSLPTVSTGRQETCTPVHTHADLHLVQANSGELGSEWLELPGVHSCPPQCGLAIRSANTSSGGTGPPVLSINAGADQRDAIPAARRSRSHIHQDGSS